MMKVILEKNLQEDVTRKNIMETSKEYYAHTH